MKTFLNDIRIPCIRPVFHDNKFAINFREKAELFNTFFAEQCSLPKNNSQQPKYLLFLTEKRLSNVQISNENIIKIINNLEPNKTHSHDMISIRMLKLGGPSLFIPWFRSTQKMINSASKTTDLSLCFRSTVRSLKDFIENKGWY